MNFLSRNYTNALRGVAILAIIVGHVGAGGFLFRYTTPLGGIGVAMFLFLSGYGLTESFKANGLAGFWTKKMRRLLVPYLIWGSTLYASCYFLSILPPPTNPLSQFLSYWFVWYLIAWYVVFYFVFRFCERQAVAIMLLFGIASFYFLPNTQSQQSLSFLLGVYVSRQKTAFAAISARRYAVLAGLLFAVGICALAVKQLPAVRDESAVWLFKGVQFCLHLPLALAMIIALVRVHPERSQFLNWCGTRSYELYLVHFVAYGCIHSQWARLAAFLVYSFGGAALLHWVCNKADAGIQKCLTTKAERQG